MQEDTPNSCGHDQKPQVIDLDQLSHACHDPQQQLGILAPLLYKHVYRPCRRML